MAFNLGTIESKVKVDGLAQFGDDLKKADATMDAFAQQTSRRFTRVEKDVKSVAKSVGMSAQEMQGSLDLALKSVSADTVARSLERVAKQMGLSAQEAASWGRQMGLSEKTVESLTGKLNGAGAGMSTLISLSKPLAGAIIGAFSVGAVTSFLGEIGSVKMQFEAFDRTLKMVTGSQTGAALALESLAATSDRLGLKLTDAADGYKLIGAAAKGTVLEGTAAKGAFEGIAAAASVLGLSASDANGVMLALSQIMSKGKVQAEELRGQIGERLPGAFQIAARAMGLTTAELDKLMSTGGLLADDFIPKFSAELQKTFGQGATEAGNSTQAAFNRMQNAWDQLTAALGDTTAFKIAIAAMSQTASVANAMAQSIRQATGTLQGAAKVASLQSRLDLLQSPEAVNAYGGPENYDPAKVKAEIERVTKELADARQSIEDAAQEQLGKARQNAINKQYEREQAAIKGGEKATLDAWAASSDRKVALWATQQKEAAAAYEKAYKGEITQDAMSVVVDESMAKYEKSLDDLAKKGAKAGEAIAKADAQAAKLINAARGKAEEAAAAFNGDTWAAKEARAAADYQKELDQLQVKLVGYKGSNRDVMESALRYWAEYEYGARKAKIAFDEWADAMKFWGDVKSQIGALSFDVAGSYEGELTKLQEAQAQAVKLAGDNQERLAAINQLYALKEVDLREKTLGDVAKLDVEYWKRRYDGAEKLGDFLKKQGADETAIAIAIAKEKSQIAKSEVDARIGYEASFVETLKDVLSSELGLYKDALTQEHDARVSASKEIASSVKDFSSTAATGITGVVKGWITGAGTMQDAFKSALDNMLDYLMTIVQKMIKYALENYVTIPIVESLVGTSGSSGLSSSSGILSKAGGWVSDLFSGGSSAADAALTSGMLSSGIGGAEGAASLAPLASEKTAELMAAGVPSLTSGMGELTSGVGALTAATEGVVPATTSLGVSLGTVATGIGALVGVGALLISGFSETKTSTKIGSGYSMSVSGTNLSASGEDYYKNTTSSMFGGTSTSHSITNTGAVDSATLAALQSEWSPYASTVTGGFKTLGIGADVSGFQFPSWDVTEEQKDDYYRNVSNAMTLYGLKQQGLQKAFDALAQENEAYVDELDRLSSAYATVSEASKQTGLSLETLAGPAYIGAMVDKMTAAGDSASLASMDFSSLSGTMDEETLQSLKDMQSQAAATGDEVQATNEQLKQLALAQYASELVAAFGSSDNVTAAYGRYFQNAYSATEQADRLLEYYGTYAGTYIGALNDASVNLTNFWAKYREAMEGGSLSASQVKAWDDAAQYVQAYDTELKAAGETWVSTNKDLIDGLKDQISALQDQADAVAAVLDLWSGFLKSIKDLRQAIAWDSNLTNLNKKQILDQMAASFTATATKAKAGDATAIAELPDLTKEYLAAAKDYYGASADYFAAFDQADATLADLQDTAQAQTDLAQSQLDALNGEIAILNVQVDQLSLVNTNLGTLASAVGDGVTAIVSAIGDSTYSSSYAASIAAANAAQQAAIAAVLAAASYTGATADTSTGGSSTGFTGLGDLYTGGSGVIDNGDGSYTIPGFAAGGSFGPGLAMVGENGPELVRFNRPGSVANSRETASLMSNRGVEARLEGIFNLLADPNRSTKTDDAILAELTALRIRMAKLEQRLQG